MAKETSALFGQVLELLDDSEYDFQVADEEEVLRLGIETENGTWEVYVRVMPDGRCVAYSKPHFDIAEAERSAVSEFITRANFGILVGNFEMDFTDGEVRFKTSFDSNGEVVPSAVIINTIEANIANMDKYLNGLEGLSTGTMSVTDALASAKA